MRMTGSSMKYTVCPNCLTGFFFDRYSIYHDGLGKEKIPCVNCPSSMYIADLNIVDDVMGIIHSEYEKKFNKEN